MGQKTSGPLACRILARHIMYVEKGVGGRDVSKKRDDLVKMGRFPWLPYYKMWFLFSNHPIEVLPIVVISNVRLYNTQAEFILTLRVGTPHGCRSTLMRQF